MQAVERVGGLQAQYSPSPYIGLWSRLKGFERIDLTSALEHRAVVKATAMRATLFILSAADIPAAVALATAARIESWTPEARRRGYDERRLTKLHARFVEAADREARTQDELKALADELLPADPAQKYPSWRIMDARGGLVHVPPSGTWRYHGPGHYRSFRSWLPDVTMPDRATAAVEAARRFLIAFGPASLDDYRKFTGERRIGRARAAFDGLGELVRYRDEAGRALVDLPGMALPDEDTPAPVRFLPRFESLVVAYDTRERMLPPDVAPAILHTRSADILASFIVDGFAAGTWTIERERDFGAPAAGPGSAAIEVRAGRAGRGRRPPGSLDRARCRLIRDRGREALRPLHVPSDDASRTEPRMAARHPRGPCGPGAR